MYSSGWKEPKNYIRPEEDGGAVEDGTSVGDDEHEEVTEKKDVAQETITSKS